MGYPTWLIDAITQKGWRFKEEARKYKSYQSPTSADRILVHKHTNVDERVVRRHLRKIGMTEDEIKSFVTKYSKHILKPPPQKSIKK